MFIPSNHEKIQTISEIIRDDLSRHEEAGGKYYDDIAQQIAGHAIQTFMPELGSMQRSRVVVEANSAVMLEEEEFVRQPSLHVQAHLQRISIQQVISTVGEPESPITYTSYDLFAVLTPQYIDPDPQEIVFGRELYVPFRDIERFESAA